MSQEAGRMVGALKAQDEPGVREALGGLDLAQ